MKSKENTTTIPSHWPRLIDAVERPESVLKWTENLDVWEDLLTDLRGNGIFPLAYNAWKREGILETLPGESRTEAEKRMVRYRASLSIMWQEIDRVLKILVEGGIEPILLKGTDLAIRYYTEPHLRPLSDSDLLFEGPKEAERAFWLLKENGFKEESLLDVKNPWRLSQHLPTLIQPDSKLYVELHGSLIYPPIDRRWQNRAKIITDEVQYYEYRRMSVRGLNPEAELVYLSAHMFGKHGDCPKVSVLYDLKYITDRVKIDWKKVEDLAIASGFAQETSIALRLFVEIFGVDTEGVLEKVPLKNIGNSMTGNSPLSDSLNTWKLMFYSGGFLGPIRFLNNMIFLPTKSLRKRYKRFVWLPSILLHFVRFGDLTWKSLKVLTGFVTRKI